MRKARWLADWRNSDGKPVFYHCVSRVVDRRFALGECEKEKFRAIMRMQENFTGCQVLAYCLMDNHFHLLLEIPPMPAEGLSDSHLLKRLSTIYNEIKVAEVNKELKEARRRVKEGLADKSAICEIHERFTGRMHNLSQFMKGLLQKYTQWHNRTHNRCGTLWEDRFKSVIVEDGLASRTMAAYIDLNPIRAQIVKEPAEYRWSSYGEAVGGIGSNAKAARAGLVRAWGAHEGKEANAAYWEGKIFRGYRNMLIGTVPKCTSPNKKDKEELKRRVMEDDVISFVSMLRYRIRYFTDGAVIGSKLFVNQAFEKSRERFGSRRKDGARKLRGTGALAAEFLWSLRDLRT